MKISQIIAAAYRKSGIAGHGQPLSADRMEAGLEAFNLMLTAWTLEGIDAWNVPGNQPSANMTDFPATADFPMGPAFREGAVFCLANRISPEFSYPPSFDENSFKAMMRAAFIEVPTVTADATLLRGAVHTRGYIR